MEPIPEGNEDVSSDESDEEIMVKGGDDNDDDEEVLMNDVPTSAISFVATEHGRLRRKQRGIDKKDLQAAKKYGVKHKHFFRGRRRDGNQAYRYTHKDIIYICDGVTGEEITSYAKPLELDLVPINASMRVEHEEAKRRIDNEEDSWTSNTVLVVDTSGSMGESDMWGTRNRLAAVWVSIALDYIAQRLECGEARSTDVISIVLLGEAASTLFEKEPCDWLLYNKVVNCYAKNLFPPKGHGNFIPSLRRAEELLTHNPAAASCAASLIFLSDGIPSDKGCSRVEQLLRIEAYLETLGKAFGRRFTFTAIGIGDDKTRFGTLQKMVEKCSEYGAIASLQLPSMASTSLGTVYSSAATSLLSTKTELLGPRRSKELKVRSVMRESRKKASHDIESVSSKDFLVYHASRIRRLLYEERYVNGKKMKSFSETTSFQNADAHHIAIARSSFGEGSECFTYRFFELAEDGKTVVGEAMVAKESRMVHGNDSKGDAEKRQRKFVKTFCATQQISRRFTSEFNSKLDSITNIGSDTPRIVILDSSIYEIEFDDGSTRTLLVESKLDHNRWYKWNSNNGYVDGMKRTPTRYSQQSMKASLTRKNHLPVDACNTRDDCFLENDIPVCYTASEVAQAFSHFTYWASRRKRLVCDLQGVFDESANLLRFSDPVIHYHNGSRGNRRRKHGATDRGRKGIDHFFETHEPYCSSLCTLMIRGFHKSAEGGRKRECDADGLQTEYERPRSRHKSS